MSAHAVVPGVDLTQGSIDIENSTVYLANMPNDVPEEIAQKHTVYSFDAQAEEVAKAIQTPEGLEYLKQLMAEMRIPEDNQASILGDLSELLSNPIDQTACLSDTSSKRC